MVGHAVRIDSHKYPRNCLLFNLGIMLDIAVDGRPYETVARKMARYLRALELESAFLSGDRGASPLPALLGRLLCDLNRDGLCVLPIGAPRSAVMDRSRTTRH